ncbi:hypothetical protein Ddc_18734 [Ditylenchus destructor]|nr:hypothetical protein Ddc_18734 [Ditylenchus destructor]
MVLNPNPGSKNSRVLSNWIECDLRSLDWTWGKYAGLDLGQERWTRPGARTLDRTWGKNAGLNMDPLLPNNTPELLWSGAQRPTFSLGM